MELFKRKKLNKAANATGPLCSHCRSTNTRVINSSEGAVRTWRGQRYITYRCNDCGHEFYVAGGKTEPDNSYYYDDDSIDEEELRAAEEDLKREIDEDGDHMFH